MSASNDRVGVVLIGHGAPATDCPPQLIGELMSLEWREHGSAHGHSHQQDSAPALAQRAHALDAQIRDWPRHGGNDPYKAGLERLGDVLRPLLPTDLFVIGYNEFCRPSIPEAIDDVIRRGATRVMVLPTMMTPGGVHSEQDIPRALEAVRRAHPNVAIEYLWPFDLQQVAALLAAQVRRVAV
ncbi:MAG: hypothetical protein COV75_08960 [Candidatus Omnitrophica bacterium CG11_big_fil_rev_8_21_14_0_20_63_9]|nr:MAG: hypothetical protein COV75_08960 [Candidatus Omnitrophica bacterium CG11_big_fil_rev_8_21_14_0_20_63_9]